MLADRVRMGLSQGNGAIEALVSCNAGQQVFRILDEEKNMLLQVGAGQSNSITLEVDTLYYLLTYGPYGANHVRVDDVSLHPFGEESDSPHVTVLDFRTWYDPMVQNNEWLVMFTKSGSMSINAG